MGPGLSASFESIIASLQSSAAPEDSSRPDFRTIRGVAIAFRNTSTGVEATAVTNAEGYYTAAYLKPGPYEMTAEAALALLAIVHRFRRNDSV
ncbi:MAG: carboxypeptidase regulatory-like domain-containing protein [Acidobacteria bacterium]|nr:carboxypeptidase regulatory-like domain-containing protein [Acidobacteriota bacterium]